MNINKWIVGIGLIFCFTTLSVEADHRRHRRTAFRLYPMVRPMVQLRAYPGIGFYARAGGYYGGRYGSVDFNVKPKGSEVYVNGTYLGLVDDLNGGFFGTTAVLPVGRNNVRIVSPRGKVYKKSIYVMPGREFNFNYRF